MDRFQFLLEDDNEEKDPERFSSRLGLTNSEKNYQAGIPEPEQEENYLNDSFGSFTRNLPIDQPSGSIVSGGREDLYHKYSQMLEQKPESERVLEDFMGRRPTFANYNPSGHDKLNAAAFGIATALNSGDANKGIAVAQAKRNEPFERSLQDYNSEGRYVNEYAKLADSGRNRQMASLLAQMRMQEAERVHQAQARNYESLDRYRKGQITDREADNKRAEEDKKYSRSKDERDFNATERHRRAMERKSGSQEDKLDSFQKSGMKEYERGREKGTLLESLGFGAPEEESYPEQLINPITGQPYTEYEIKEVLGKSKKYRGGLFNKPQEF